jgi:ribose 5-phosphate isomerase RpiB
MATVNRTAAIVNPSGEIDAANAKFNGMVAATASDQRKAAVVRTAHTANSM